jgi:hypothetical protein
MTKIDQKCHLKNLSGMTGWILYIVTVLEKQTESACARAPSLSVVNTLS